MKKVKPFRILGGMTVIVIAAFFQLHFQTANATQPGEEIYTLLGNAAGTKFCCCPGTMTCGAACCETCPYD